MAGRLTPLGVFLKWVVVPVSLGAVGYFLIGPRVDSKVAKEITDKVSEVTGNAMGDGDPAEGEAAPEESPSSKFAPPEVDVTVTALNSRPTTTRRRRRRAPSTPQTSTPSQPVVAPPPSSGGETTAPADPG